MEHKIKYQIERALCPLEIWRKVMAIITMITAMKKIHPADIIFIKIGNFFHVYGKDAYIISYFFEYKIKTVEKIPTCGFPINSINRIRSKLEENKINYLIVDRRNNYDVNETYDFKNLNNYEKYFEKARPVISTRNRIKNINQYLSDNENNKDTKKLLNDIERLIHERRKI